MRKLLRDLRDRLTLNRRFRRFLEEEDWTPAEPLCRCRHNWASHRAATGSCRGLIAAGNSTADARRCPCQAFEEVW